MLGSPIRYETHSTDSAWAEDRATLESDPRADWAVHDRISHLALGWLPAHARDRLLRYRRGGHPAVPG